MTNGDQALAKADAACINVNLNFNFKYGNTYSNCCININGYITFDAPSYSLIPSYQYFIAPFSHNLATNINGNIFYRSTRNSHTLNLIGQEINSLKYSNTVNYMPTNAFIVTWDTVASADTQPNPYASFQIILSTDGSNSFLTINYGTLGFTADYGYFFQYGSTKFTLTNPKYSSNVGVNGKWIFSIRMLLII